MKTSTRFLAAFAAGLAGRGGHNGRLHWEYSPEDAAPFDLAMFGSMLGLGGLMMCGAVGFPALRFLGRRFNGVQTDFRLSTLPARCPSRALSRPCQGSAHSSFETFRSRKLFCSHLVFSP